MVCSITVSSTATIADVGAIVFVEITTADTGSNIKRVRIIGTSVGHHVISLGDEARCFVPPRRVAFTDSKIISIHACSEAAAFMYL